MNLYSVLALAGISWCINMADAADLPIIPGSITTLRKMSADELYMPYTLSRSLYASDGPNAFLLTDSSALVQMIASVNERTNYSITQLAGHPVISGYVDSNPKDSRFDHISDFAQSEDGAEVYIVDQNNHCIRLFDRTWNNVTVFAGVCTQYGLDTGPHLVAKFSSPSGIVMSTTWTELYVADRQNNRILSIDLTSEEKWVQTVLDNTYPAKSRIILPTSIRMSSSGDKLYMTTENGLVKLTNFTGNDALPVRRVYDTKSMRSNMLALTLIDNDRYVVVTDFNDNKILFVDLVNGGTGQMCTGHRTLPFNRTDGSSDVCEISTPQGVAPIDDTSLFITERDSRVVRRVSYQLPAEGLKTTQPPSTTPFIMSTSSVPVTKRKDHHKTTTKVHTTSRFAIFEVDIEAGTEKSQPTKEKSPLVLGLAGGILIPLILVGVLVSLVSYIKLQAKRHARLIYARRTEQGGYNGPGLEEHNHHSDRPRSSSISDQPPSYTPTHAYSLPSVHLAATA